jgi:hypothetical protein
LASDLRRAAWRRVSVRRWGRPEGIDILV